MRLNSRHIAIAIFGLALLVRLLYWWQIGTQVGGDTTFYQAAAQTIVDAGGNPTALQVERIPFYYWFYPTLIALLGGSNTAVVLIQITVAASAAAALYQMGRRMFGQTAGIIAGLGYALWWEVFQWDVKLLTDSLFISLLIITSHSILIAVQTKQGGWRIVSGVLVVLSIFMRPTTLPFYAAIYVITTHQLRPLLRIGAVTVVAVLGLGIAYSTGFLEPNYNHGVHSFAQYFMSLYHGGVVVRDRSEYTINLAWEAGLTVTNIRSFITLLSHRLVAFWSPYSRNFHAAHIVLNTLTLLPLYGLALVGAVWRNRSPSQQREQQFLVSIIAFYWIFQALTEVDYDWRYRLPVLPFMLLFASSGIVKLWQRWRAAVPTSQLVRYGIVGIVSTIVDVTILNAALLGQAVSLFWATAAGFLAGGITGYLLHSRWTFKYDTHGQHIHKLSQVLFVSAGGLALTELVMHVLTYNAAWHHNAAKAAAVVISAAWAFSMLRWWVFADRRATQHQQHIIAERKP